MHSEISLNELLELDAAHEFLGEDLQFELQGLLVERVGYNFRNEFAHGLMPDMAFYSTAAIYLWWLLFHIVIRLSPVLCQQPLKDTEIKSDKID